MPQGIGFFFNDPATTEISPLPLLEALPIYQRTMTIPPGEYQVAMQPIQFDSQRVVWPQDGQGARGQPGHDQLANGVLCVKKEGIGPLGLWLVVGEGALRAGLDCEYGARRTL